MVPLSLDSSVQFLRGCGPKKAAALSKLGIKTVRDLLEHYPIGYTFAPPITPIRELQEGQMATVVGEITWTQYTVVARPPRFVIRLSDVCGREVQATWFNGGYLRTQLFRGNRLMVSGKFDRGQFTNPAFCVLRDGGTPIAGELDAVTYHTTAGITSRDISRLVRNLPDEVWSAAPLWVRPIHMPDCQTTADAARKQAKWDELFWMQLALAVRQKRREAEPPTVRCIEVCGQMAYFPFEPTKDQDKATADIVADLCRPRAMNRLLQGDVGCGKSYVAAYAALVMAFNGGQTAILCPTEILARQHYETIKGYFERAGVRCQLVTGDSLPTEECTWRSGHTSDIVVGTTAMLTQGFGLFRKLGLVVVDELHKFGVEQRAALRRHGNPHVLSMSATPIPRTIAMTVFGDLDVSVIRSMPPGRRPVLTYWITSSSDPWEDRIMIPELSAGHQVYVVCPRIEALDDEMRAVEEVAKEYERRFPETRVDCLHGRMSSSEKQQVCERWADPVPGGRILVSTTVVEVGVDNPNATVMVIEGAERFGLAQLHQLRGRVGRSGHQSYCFLLSDTESQDARARLRAMESTTDGFSIAEEDLKIRGPGDLFDITQHGMPNLRIADLCGDYPLLVEARKEARDLVAKGPLPAEMVAELWRRYGDRLALGDVG